MIGGRRMAKARKRVRRRQFVTGDEQNRKAYVLGSRRGKVSRFAQVGCVY